MRSVLEGSRAWLRGNSIRVPDDWLAACVEWIQEENQGSNQTQDEINSLVYEQWLLADLHELEIECLPAEIQTATKFELRGTYALQIDSILDVGRPYYIQQLKVKGTENSNVGVSADEPSQKPWEAKPTRMLLMRLTDGKQTVQGMEYRPISSLSPQTVPGTKIQVSGVVLCRHAVLMLGEDNVRLLGGEVDTLMEANTQLNVLQSAMEMSTEFAGKCHKQQFNGSEVRYPKKGGKGGAKCSTEPPQHNTWQQGAPRNSMEGNNRGSTSQFRGGQIKQELHSQKPDIKHAMGQPPMEEQWDDDDFLDDMDINDFDQEVLNAPQPQVQITNQQSMPGTSHVGAALQTRVKTSASQAVSSRSAVARNIQPVGSCNNSAVSNRKQPASRSDVTVPQRGVIGQNRASNIDEFPDFEDTDFDESWSHAPANNGNRISVNVATNSADVKRNTITRQDILDMGDFVDGFEDATVSRNVENSTNVTRRSTLRNENMEGYDDLFDGDDDDFPDSIGDEKQTGPVTGSDSSLPKKQTTGSNQKKSALSLKARQSNDSNKPTIKPVNTRTCDGAQVKFEHLSQPHPSVNNPPVVIENMNINITMDSNGHMDIQARPLLPAERTQLQSDLNLARQNARNVPNSDHANNISIHSTAGRNGSDRNKKPKLDRDGIKTEIGAGDPLVTGSKEPGVSVSDSDSSYPFVYLANVMKWPVTVEPRIYTVKAYISTLTSKLTQANNQWCLSCKINDGTMAIDVDLSNKVLTQLIGFSAEESQVMKQRARTDRSVREVLQEGIRQCQQKLVELYGLLELEISAARPKPTVLVTRRIDTHHIELLYNRVMSSWHKIKK